MRPRSGCGDCAEARVCAEDQAIRLGFRVALLEGNWSGKRDSNSRLPPWQGGALPTELFPLRRSEQLPWDAE